MLLLPSTRGAHDDYYDDDDDDTDDACKGGVQSRAQVALMFKVSLIFIFLFFLHLSLFCVSSSLSPVLYNFVSKAAHASS